MCDIHITDYLAPSANPSETKSERETDHVDVPNKPKTFLLSTNTDVGLSSTYHTAPHQPSLEDDANRVPISGPETWGGNADYMGTQIVQEKQFTTTENPSA